MPDDQRILMEVPEQLTSARLTLRIPRPGDGQRINQAVLESIKELQPWMPWATPTPGVDDTERWVRKAYMAFVARDQFHYTLHLKNTDTFIGTAGMHRIKWDVPTCEIGYWLRTSYCGKGYMTEAVEVLAKLALDVLGANRLEIRCDQENRRSYGVAERLGFVLEGTLKHDSRSPAGELRSTQVYARTRD